jgi:hypothetical protein
MRVLDHPWEQTSQLVALGECAIILRTTIKLTLKCSAACDMDTQFRCSGGGHAGMPLLWLHMVQPLFIPRVFVFCPVPETVQDSHDGRCRGPVN